MKINTIQIQNNGYISCKSSFYSSEDILQSGSNYTFVAGVNKLIGEIDSGNWAVSYLLSMYQHRPKDFVLFEAPNVLVNSGTVSLHELSKYSCYMDESYPLFSTKATVRKLVTNGLKKYPTNATPDDIKKMFFLDDQRFDRPLTGVGNEIFRSMAAIGYCHQKEIFCFPWFSNKRFEYYHKNMTYTLELLNNLGKVVVVPVGMPVSKT